VTFVEREVPADVRDAIAKAPHLGDQSVTKLLALASQYAEATIPYFDDMDDKARLTSASNLYVAARLMIRKHIEGEEWAETDMVLGVLLVAEDLVGQVGPDMGVTETLEHLSATIPTFGEVTYESIAAGA
jgi:hypothetical protein